MGAGTVAAVPSLVGTVTMFEPWDALQSIACGTRQDFRRTDLATLEGRGVFAVEMNVGQANGQRAKQAFGIGPDDDVAFARRRFGRTRSVSPR